MIGRSINKKIRTELDERKKALGRNSPDDATSNQKSTYSLDDLSIRTSYVRLVSPVYGTEIKGRLLQQDDFIYSSDEDGNSPVAVKAKDMNNLQREYWNTQNRGIVPPAGITSVTTAYTGEGATINTTKEATIELTCFSLLQYEQLVEEFIMIGRILYLEFGWSGPKIDAKRITADTRNFLTKKIVKDGNIEKPQIVLDMKAVEKYPQELILNTSGNTDLFVGIVKNYEAKANENGGFDFTITMVTAGASMYNSTFGQDNSEMVTLGEPAEESDNEPFENPSADVRDEMVLMAKLRGIIQEDFNIEDVLSFAYSMKIRSSENRSDRTEAPVQVFRGTQYSVYNTGNEPEKEFENLKTLFESRDFEVKVGVSKYLIAKHKSNDLIISLVCVEEKQAQGFSITTQEIVTNSRTGRTATTDLKPKMVKGYAFYINYYISMRYLEDNVLNRIFGTVDDTGTIRGGIRSCYWSSEEDREITQQGLRNVENADDFLGNKLVNNKIMMHDVLVPKNLNEVLINTDATQNVLKRAGAGMYPDSFTEEGWLGYESEKFNFTTKDYKSYTADLSEMISSALPFFNPDPEPFIVENPPESIPNTKVADYRHMYVNVDIVQRAFLSSQNEAFYERNQFTSNKQQRQNTTVMSGGKEMQVQFNLDPLEPTFRRQACVSTFKEGMNNLLNTITNNLHNLPMLELGGNISLPDYISVLDMRYTKEDVSYTFDSFSRTSIVKSVDLSSQVPTLVQLAAYFGTTQTRMDRVLGNQSTHVPVDLLQNINDRYNKLKQDEYSQGKYRGLNFGKSNYFDSAGNIEEFGSGKKIISDLKLALDKTSVFSAGIGTNLIYTPDTSKGKSDGGQNENPEDLTIRKNIPGLQGTIVENATKINKVITSLSGKQDPKFSQLTKNGTISLPTDKKVGGKVMPQTYQFKLIQGDISENYREPTLEIKTHPDFQHYIDTILYDSDKQSFNKLQGKISFFTLTIVIDGIAGIFPGDAFLISHLPAYIKNKYYFIVSNVEQSLTSEGWSTTITALQKPRRKTIENALPIEEDLAIAYTPEEGTIPVDYGLVSDEYDPSLIPGQRGGNPDPLTGPVTQDMNSTNQRLLRGTDEDQDPADAQAELTSDQQSQIPRNTDGPMPSREADEPGPPAPPDADYDPNAVAERLNDERGIAIMNPKTAGKLQIGMDFELKREPPKVMPDVKPFIPYEITQNGTAEILLSKLDGNPIIETPPDGPKTEVKIYPGGDASDPEEALTFSLGVVDILSVDEVNDIIDTYVDLGGNQQEIEATIKLNYEQVSVEDRDEVTNSEEAGRKFGSWDKKRGGSSKEEKVVVYIKKDADIMTNLINQTAGNPDLKDPDNNTASGNNYVDDILHAIITQPERINITGDNIVTPGLTQEVEVEPAVDVEPLIETETDDDENQEADTSESSGTDGAESNPEVVVEEIPEQTKVTPPRVAVSKKIVTPGLVLPTKTDMASLRLADYVGLTRYATRAENNAKTPLLGQADIMLNRPVGINGVTPIVRGGKYGDIKVHSYVDKDQFNDMYSQLFPEKVEEGKLPNSEKKYERMAVGIFEFKLVPFNGYEGLVSSGDTINVLGLGTGDSVTNIDRLTTRAKNTEFKLAARTASRIAVRYFNENYGVETSYDAEGQVIDGVKSDNSLTFVGGEVQRN